MAISNEAFSQIMREYEIRQRDRADLIDSRRNELYEAIPQLASIDTNIASMGREQLANLLGGSGPTSDSEDYHDFIDRQVRRKRQLIAEAGYPDDYLDPPYVCSDCRDTGYIDGRKCHCLAQKILNYGYMQEPLMAQLEGARLSDFSLDYYPEDKRDEATGSSAYESASNALRAATDFINTEDRKHRNFILYGSTGSGKTFLSCCMGNALREQGCTVVYQTAVRLFEMMGDHAFHREGPRSSYDQLHECDLLIIDDLGTELQNSFTEGALFELLNYRMISGASTIISTNLSMQDILKVYTGRIFSRLLDSYQWMHLFGADVRIVKATNRDIHN